MNYSVEAGSVKARVPVVIFRNKLAERTTYYLRLEIVENDFFKTGVKTELHRTVVFSKDLLTRYSLYLDIQFCEYAIARVSIFLYI